MMSHLLKSYYIESIILWYDLIFIFVSGFIIYLSNLKYVLITISILIPFFQRVNIFISLMFSKYKHVGFVRGLMESLSSQGRF